MQFLSARRYIANVVDGKVQFYGHRSRELHDDETEAHHQAQKSFPLK
jgi:hypothetical protein